MCWAWVSESFRQQLRNSGLWLPDSPSGFRKHLSRKRVIWGLVALDVALFMSRRTATIATLLGLGLAIYGLFCLVKVVFRRSSLIWRLRHRLIVTYMFIGGVPILLI